MNGTHTRHFSGERHRGRPRSTTLAGRKEIADQEAHDPTPARRLGVLARQLNWQETSGVLILVLLLIAVCAHRLAVLAGNPAPPGSDGGNWLAFSAEVFGARVKAAEAAYPPVFPFIVRVARAVLPPLTALKAVGILSSVFVAVPAYLILRTTLRPWLAAGMAAATVVTTYASEVFAWGGYPQHMGTAFLLFAVYFLQAGLRSGGSWRFLAGGIAAGLAVGAHTLGAAELAVAVAAALALAAYGAARRGFRPDAGRLLSKGLIWLGALAVLLAAVSPAYGRIFVLLAGNPANPHGFDLFDSIPTFGSWHADGYLWLVLGVICVPAALWLALSRRRAPAADAAVAVVAGAGIILLAQSEIRTVHLLQIGVLFASGAVLGAINAPGLDGFRRPPRFAANVALAALLLGVVAAGVQHTRTSAEWYRVIDRPALAALDWLRERQLETPGDGRVLTGETDRSGIYGWWVEGYAGLPAYLAIDPRWVSFKDEKEQTAAANRMMDGSADPAETRSLAARHNIRYALVDTIAAPEAARALLDAGFVLNVEIERMAILSRIDGAAGR